VEEAIRETDNWWQEWSGRCSYQGKWRDAVLRSLITLKGLTFLPTGELLQLLQLHCPNCWAA